MNVASVPLSVARRGRLSVLFRARNARRARNSVKWQRSEARSVLAQRAPGCAASHYAPSARVVAVSPGEVAQVIDGWLGRGRRVGLLSTRRPASLPSSVVWLPLAEEDSAQARQLYACLRQADHLHLDVLVAVLPPAIGIGQALRDRLRRAAGRGGVSGEGRLSVAAESDDGQ